MLKYGAIEFSLMQRCAAHLASAVDVEEAFNAGREAVKSAVNGHSKYMIAFERVATTHIKSIMYIYH